MGFKKSVVVLLAATGTAVILGGCNRPGHPMGQMPSMGTSTPVHPHSAGADHSMDINLGPKDATFDLRFIDGMILHHEGAIAMAKTAMQSSNRSEIQQIAKDIIEAQQAEIEQMQQWRQAWYPNAKAVPMMYDVGTGKTIPMPLAMQTTMHMASGFDKVDETYDLHFLNAMIGHHEAALIMADQVLTNSERSELQQLANTILQIQTEEIVQMRQWQYSWYGWQVRRQNTYEG